MCGGPGGLYILSDMIVQGSADILHKVFHLKETYADYLDQSQTSVKYDYQTEGYEKQRTAAFK